MKILKPMTSFFVLVCMINSIYAVQSGIEIRIKNGDPSVAYSAAELSGYLDRMAISSGSGVITIGLFEDCGVKQIPELPDRYLDDALIVEVKNGSGFIAGSNPRSVLLGVYRFLSELGCSWVRPGASGEVIPRKDIFKASVSLNETASFRNRIICIEGAVSLSNTLDMIEWMPKVGFNGFQMQFRDGYTFFDRWYSHHDNPELKRSVPIAREVAQEYTVLIEKEIERRGLLYHAVGHGWHTEAFGVPALGWITDYNLPKDFLDHVAVVKGQRTVNWERPTLTALCYSDTYVQEKMAGYIADYAQEHTNVDYLHVWLEDGGNSKCECGVCRQKRPADFYIQILNKLDRELSARNLDTRIIFIGYSDLLWIPVQEKLNDSKRFSFIYANARKDFSLPLNVETRDVSVLPFRLNQMQCVCNEDKYSLGFLREWVQYFPGDRMVYDYYSGAETLEKARVVWQDVRNYDKLGLNGLVNCQSLRVFFPNGFGMSAMGRTLWNKKQDFDKMADEYFNAAYGQDGSICLNHMKTTEKIISDCDKAIGKDTASVRKNIILLRNEMNKFAPVVKRNLAAENTGIRTSWQMMDHYLTMMDFYARFAEANITDEGQSVHLIRNRCQQFVFSLEKEYQPCIQSEAYFHRYMR